MVFLVTAQVPEGRNWKVTKQKYEAKKINQKEELIRRTCPGSLSALFKFAWISLHIGVAAKIEALDTYSCTFVPPPLALLAESRNMPSPSSFFFAALDVLIKVFSLGVP